MRSCLRVSGSLLCEHLVCPFHFSTVCETNWNVYLIGVCLNVTTSSLSETKGNTWTFVSEWEHGMNFWWDALGGGGGTVICLLWFADGTSNDFTAIRPWHEAVLLLSLHLCNRGKLHLHVPFFRLCFLGWVSSPAWRHPPGVWQLCLWWAVRALLRVCTPTTPLHGGMLVIFVLEEHANKAVIERGGQD